MGFGDKEPEVDKSDEIRKNQQEKDRLDRLRNAQFLKNNTVSTPQSRLSSASTTSARLGSPTAVKNSLGRA